MSGVGVSGLIANLPTTVTPYPTQDPSFELGGFRSDVATIADRNGIPANFRVEGMVVYVRATKCFYTLAADLVNWDFQTSNQAELSKQTLWSVNIVSGSDNNTGLPGSPVATVEEISRRLCPNGQRLDMVGPITITLQANGIPTAYGKLLLHLGTTTAGTKLFAVQGEYSSSVNILLSSVVAPNTATNTRAELVSLAAAFVANKRLRNTTAGARLGNLAIASNLNGSANDVFVGTGWVNVFTGSIAEPLVGDTVAQDTLLVTLDLFSCVTEQGVFAGAQDLIITRLVTQAFNSAVTLSSSPSIWGCETTNSASTVINAFGGLTLNAHRFSFPCVMQGDLIGLLDCSIQAEIDVFCKCVQFNALSARSILDGGTFVIGAAHLYGASTVSVTGTGSLEHQNGTGKTAYTIGYGSQVVCSGTMWGAGGYTLGFNIFANSTVVANVLGGSSGLFFGATTNFSVCGRTFSYAQGPRVYSLSKAGVVLDGGAPLLENDIEVVDAPVAGAVAVNFTAGLTHGITITQNTVATFVAPVAPCVVVLRVIEGGAGGFTLSLAGLTVKGYAALTVTTAGAQNVLTFYWTGAQLLLTSQVGYA